MTKKKKKAEDIGTVLHKIDDRTTLKPWAEYMAGVDPWKFLDITADKLLERWLAAPASWHFFSAADPKSAKVKDFDHQHGLIVFAADGGRGIVEGISKTSLPGELSEAGYVASIATKVRHKGVGKYLLRAAERVISEKYGRVFLFVSERNQSAQRFYKGAGYEEISRVQDCIKAENTEILLTKQLSG